MGNVLQAANGKVYGTCVRWWFLIAAVSYIAMTPPQVFILIYGTSILCMEIIR